MATRKSKGRGGSSGRGNPRNDDRITEEQHDEAMRVLRAEYYQSVRGMAEDLRRAIKDGEVSDIGQWIHETVDGSYWVIYTHANFQVLMCSDNHDAYSEDFGEPPVQGNDINWAALAYAAMARDLQRQIDAEGIELEEAPRRAREMPRASEITRPKIGQEVYLEDPWRWVSGNEYYNDKTDQWAREVRQGIGVIVRPRNQPRNLRPAGGRPVRGVRGRP